MKKLFFALSIVVSQNVFAGELADALSAAIQSSDSEKTNTKVALLVAEEHIEKATFKRGQKQQVIKDDSAVIADNTYTPQTSSRRTDFGFEKSQIDAIEKELGDKK